MDEKERRDLLVNWTLAQGESTKAKAVLARELELRKQVIAEYFPAPVEGVNTLKMEGGWELKATYKIDRKLDEGSLPAIQERLREMGVNADQLIRFAPSLDLRAYKTLAITNPVALSVFELTVISKPGSPVLELKPPKVSQ